MPKPTLEQRAAVLHHVTLGRRRGTIAAMLGLSKTCVEQVIQTRYTHRLGHHEPDTLDLLERDRYLTRRGLIP